MPKEACPSTCKNPTRNQWLGWRGEVLGGTENEGTGVIELRIGITTFNKAMGRFISDRIYAGGISFAPEE